MFVGVMHTSDVIGDPESRIGNVDVYTNGGRLQPGCYNNENNITECKLSLIQGPWYIGPLVQFLRFLSPFQRKS